MILFGASGHGKVVLDALKGEVSFFFDDNSTIKNFMDLEVLSYSSNQSPKEQLVISIGDNKLRKLVAEKVSHPIGVVIAESSVISAKSIIKEGSQVLQGAIIQSSSIVGKHCIVNTAASIDHDCVVEDFCHIAPKATLCGNVKVGEGTLIGAGSTVIPGIKIGKWCTIGAGSVIIKDIPDFATVVGNPGRIIKTTKL